MDELQVLSADNGLNESEECIITPEMENEFQDGKGSDE